MKERIIVEKTNQVGGVYVIFNPITLKAYVGETMDFYRRWAEHVSGICIPNLSYASNDNLKNEDVKSFDIFPIVFANYNKTNNAFCVKDWLIHETIVMYIFRKYGIELYNSKQGKDNTGIVKRAFLYNYELSADELFQEINNYLASADLDSEYLESIGYKDWDELLVFLETEINNVLEEKYGINLLQFTELRTEREQRQRLWNNRTKNIASEAFYSVKPENEKQVRKLCKELYDLYLSKELSISNLKQYGLHEIDVDEFSNMALRGLFDKIIVSKFGKYYDQKVSTILATKVYDIENNLLNNLEGLELENENKESGVCFWALKNLNLLNTRKFLSDEGTNKTSRYAIMLYTSSQNAGSSAKGNSDLQLEYLHALNPHDFESIKDFFDRSRRLLDVEPIDSIAGDKFALGYFSTSGNKKYSYPSTMFPEVVQKTSKKSVALLISELSYVNMYCKDAERFYNYYNSYLDKYTDELSVTLGSTKTGGSQCSHCRAKLKDGKRVELAKLLRQKENYDSEKDIATFIIAKLEYPYIVGLSDD